MRQQAVRCLAYRVLTTRYMVPLPVLPVLALFAGMLVPFGSNDVLADEPPPFYLGGRSPDDLPALSAEEMASPQQQAMLSALGGEPYGQRAKDHQRAGCAMHVRRYAIPSNTRHYGGYWVGGGAPVLGSSPFLDEGTFGWDYFGWTFPKRVALNWTHGRHQGGAGAYQTDGPRLHRR